jgi:hypothetical protein
MINLLVDIVDSAGKYFLLSAMDLISLESKKRL